MARLRALLFGSKLKAGTTVVVLLIGLLGGAFAVGVLGVPAIDGLENTFGEVSDETTTVETDLVISNPNPFGVSSEDVSVSYALAMNDVEMAEGEASDVSVDAGNSTVPLTTELDNEAIPAWWVSHVDRGERTTVTVDATARSDRLSRESDVTHEHDLETEIIDEFNSSETRPVNANQPLVDDPVLYINETTGEWGEVSESETPIETTFVVHNPNAEPYAITELGYEITMNDVEVGEGATHEEHVIAGGATESVEATTAIDADELDEWWVTHLDEEIHGHQVTELRIEFYAVIELPTGEAITVPLDELTYEERLETDVFNEGLHSDRNETETGDDATVDDERDGDDQQNSDRNADDGGDDDGGDDAGDDSGDDAAGSDDAGDDDGGDDSGGGDSDDNADDGLPLSSLERTR